MRQTLPADGSLIFNVSSVCPLGHPSVPRHAGVGGGGVSCGVGLNVGADEVGAAVGLSVGADEVGAAVGADDVGAVVGLAVAVFFTYRLQLDFKFGFSGNMQLVDS